MAAATILTAAKQPDIGYTPDLDKYRQRTSHRLKNENLKEKQIPYQFPKKLTSNLVWDNDGLSERYDWTYELTSEDIKEINLALETFRALNRPLGFVNQDTFPLPNLHATLREISRELHLGHGFKVIRGVPVELYTREENVIIYAGISSHIAPIRGRQDSSYKGQPADVVISHIKDLSTTADRGQIGAPAYTADKQVFHTDAGDIVSLFALSTAAEGGTSRIASTWRVYNELAASRPDLIDTLANDWPTENFTTTGGSYQNKPLIYHQPRTEKLPERIVLQYARRYFTGFGALPRSPHIPPISEAQAEALDALHFLGERFNVGLDFRRGDIQYINNLAVFHARDGFTDTPKQQRHLVRLWLRDPEYAWETPAILQGKWDQLYKGVTAESQVFPLEPYIRSASNSTTKDSENTK